MWGSPVAHSLSPALHNAAYGALGVEAGYSWREVTATELAGELATLPPDFRGLSLTMPLKEAILHVVPDHRGLVDELGAANTVIRADNGWYLWNTDPAGVLGALADAGVHTPSDVIVLGAGATARSVVCAVAELGIARLRVVSRDRERSALTLEYAGHRGVAASWVALEDLSHQDSADLVVSTLPHGVDCASDVSPSLVAAAALLDVTYHPWPSPLARRWESSSHPRIAGTSMLLHQAVVQIRLMVGGSAKAPLTDENLVIEAMRAAIA